MLDDICHLLLQVLSLCRLLLQIGDSFVDFAETVVVGASVCQCSDKVGSEIFERRVFFLARDLTRSDKHDSHNSVIAFFLLDGILDRLDMERYGETIDRQDDSLFPMIDNNLLMA